MVTKQFYWHEDLAELRVFGKMTALKIVNGLVDAGFFAGLRLVNAKARVKVYAVHFEKDKAAYALASELQRKYENDPYFKD